LVTMRLQGTVINYQPQRRVRSLSSWDDQANSEVAGQMAKYLGKALNKTSAISELVTQPGFKWKNRGSMVFIGDKNVRTVPLLREDGTDE
jgi:hypothetical protein